MDRTYREHKGHRIEAGENDPGTELLIDGESTAYGQYPDGKYFLYEYAYDPADDLMDLAMRYIDYRDRTDEVRAKSKPG